MLYSVVPSWAAGLFIGRHQQQKLRDELLHIVTTSKELLALLDISDKDIEDGVSF